MKHWFQSFLEISNVLLPYLKQFQTDAPMMPSVSDALEAILRRLMKMILRSQVVDEVITPLQLIKIDLEKKTHFLPLDALKLPTATKAMLQPLKASSPSCRKEVLYPIYLSAACYALSLVIWLQVEKNALLSSARWLRSCTRRNI